MPRRVLLVLLLPLLLGACGVATAPAEAKAPPLVVASQLLRWSAWARTATTAHQEPCAPSQQSELWFLTAPPAGSTYWSCRMPTGASLLVVATVLSGVDLRRCSRDYAEQVGVDGSAALDGQPVALRWVGPLTASSGPAPFPSATATCTLTGRTAPLTAGHHLLVVQYVLTDHSRTGTATIDVNAS